MALNALLGLLAGVGGFGKAVGDSNEEWRKEQERREALKLAQQKADDERRYRDADITLRRDTLNRETGTPIGALSRWIGYDLGPDVNPNEMVSKGNEDKVMAVLAAKKAQAEEARNASETAAFMRRAEGRPAVPPDLERAETEVGQLAVPKMGRTEVAAGLTERRVKPSEMDALMKTIGYGEPKEPKELNATSQIMAAAGQLQDLLDSGETADTSAAVRRLTAQLNAAKIIATQAGGSAFGAGDLLGNVGAPQSPAPGQGQQPRTPSGPRPLVQTPGVPSPGERGEIGETDARIAGFGKLVEQARSPEIAPMLGVRGFLGRAGEDWLKMDNLTPAQREFRARAAIELLGARKLMLGVGQSRPELAGAAPALPGENDPGYAEKLAAWGAWAQENRDALNNALTGSNIRVPPQRRPQLGEPGYTGRLDDVPATTEYAVDPTAKVKPKLPDPGPGRIWIRAPDGVWGKWDASQPIPQGYRR